MLAAHCMIKLGRLPAVYLQGSLFMRYGNVFALQKHSLYLAFFSGNVQTATDEHRSSSSINIYVLGKLS